jgi:hypothetical protein
VYILLHLVQAAFRFYILSRLFALRVVWPFLRDLALVPAFAFGFLWAIDRSAGGWVEWLLLLSLFTVAACRRKGRNGL